ncbi:MAG: aminoacyl-tRNA hydrolase [Halanaerobiaceae bacterium]
MKLVVGLGNPGNKYAGTRHNVGFQALKFIAGEYGIGDTDFRNNALQASGEIAEKKVVLAQPTTYMNKSGRAVKKLLAEYNLDPADLLVIHDDLDLPVGKIRIKVGGSSAGHNGLKSIIKNLNTRDFNRIRIGIGRPREGVEIRNFVLTTFSSEEKKKIEQSYEEVAAALKVILLEGYQKAMNDFN